MTLKFSWNGFEVAPQPWWPDERGNVQLHRIELAARAHHVANIGSLYLSARDRKAVRRGSIHHRRYSHDHAD